MKNFNILLGSNDSFHIGNFDKLNMPKGVFLRIYVIRSLDKIESESTNSPEFGVSKTNDNFEIQEASWQEANKIAFDIFIGHSRDFNNEIFFEEIWKSTSIKKFLLIRDVSDSIEIRHRCIELEIKFEKLVFSIFENRIYTILEKASQLLAKVDSMSIFRCSLWSKYHSQNITSRNFALGKNLVSPHFIRRSIAQDQVSILKFLFGSVVELKNYNITKDSSDLDNSLIQNYFISENYSNLIGSVLLDQNYWPATHGGEIIYKFGQISWDWNRTTYTSLSRNEGLSIFDLPDDANGCDSFINAWNSNIRYFLGLENKA